MCGMHRGSSVVLGWWLNSPSRRRRRSDGVGRLMHPPPTRPWGSKGDKMSKLVAPAMPRVRLLRHL